MKNNKYSTSPNDTDYHFIIDGGAYAYCVVNVFSLNGKNSYTDAKDLFGIDKDIPLQDNEYAYGINITREYKYDPSLDVE